MNQSKKVFKAGLTYSEEKANIRENLKLRMILKHKEKEKNMKEKWIVFQVLLIICFILDQLQMFTL
jgi:hypothetical protein